jgi:hypothetical protein
LSRRFLNAVAHDLHPEKEKAQTSDDVENASEDHCGSFVIDLAGNENINVFLT